MIQIGLGKNNNLFLYPNEIIQIDQEIRDSNGRIIKSRRGIEHILKKAETWYDKETETIRDNEKGLSHSIRYSRVGKVCKNISDTITTSATSRKEKINKINWLMKRSNVEVAAGNALNDENENEYSNLNHRYKCYGFSADCDREIGKIYKNLDDYESAYKYIISSIEKYTGSVYTAGILLTYKPQDSEVKKIKQYISITHNFVAELSLLMFEMTHDDEYLDCAKNFNDISISEQKNNKYESFLNTQKRIQIAYQDLNNEFRLDQAI